MGHDMKYRVRSAGCGLVPILAGMLTAQTHLCRPSLLHDVLASCRPWAPQLVRNVVGKLAIRHANLARSSSTGQPLLLGLQRGLKHYIQSCYPFLEMSTSNWAMNELLIAELMYRGIIKSGRVADVSTTAHSSDA
jgi:hypothetical protein